MELDLTAALAVFLVVAVWRLVRHRTSRGRGPLPDVPDAPPSAAPIEAPGMTLPYSSLDPFAPSKKRRDGRGTDGVPEVE